MQLHRHFVCLLLFFFVSLVASQHKNVCSSMTSYTTFLMQISESCWYNEDVGKSSQELMETYNYHFETHKVTTKDGYILTMFRIRGNGKPILLIHGLFSTSQSFLSIGKRSHAFVLSEQGYDIWLANLRGSIYSNQHADETISEADYWNFSVQETAFYDIPALVDEIRVIRRNEGLEDKKVIPIGWTMAFSALNIYATFNKTHAEENVAALVGLSPITYFNYVSSPIIRYGFLLANFMKDFTHPLGIHKLAIHDKSDENFYYNLCLHTPVIKTVCYWITYSYFASVISPETIPMLITALGATSLRNIEHFGQIVHDYGQLRLRDLGSDENLKIYGQLAPPVVDFSKIDHKMRIFYGRRDNIAVSTDVLNFCEDMKDLGKDIKCTPIGTEPEYDHINFLYSDKIEELQFELLKTLDDI